jgi:CubicO group peptidase (beta-lactamase class C family)
MPRAASMLLLRHSPHSPAPRRPVRISLIVVLALGTASPLPSQSTQPNPSRIERGLRPAVRLSDHADTAFDLVDRMRFYHVPAVSIAVVDSDRVVWAKGFGVKQFGGTEPVDTSTLFLAGSISKPVFATGLLELVEQGKLDLDKDVNTYLRSWHLPESPFTSDQKVTLRRILSHSAGLTVWGFPGYTQGTPIPTVPQILNGEKPANTQAVRSDTVPGARWRYSGGGITIAQLVATDVSGESFPELMRRLVLQPAGMVHSTYENPPPPAVARFAAAGHERPDTVVPGQYHVYPEMAAAGLWTTPSDLGRWSIAIMRAYRGSAGGPLSPAMAKQMLTPQVEVSPQFAGPVRSYWGLGIELQGVGDSLHFTHGGRDEGFVADLVMWPAHRRGIVVMTNGVSGALLQEIERAFGAEYGLTTVPRTEKRLATIAAATLDSLPGKYRLMLGRDTIDILVTRRGNDLWVATSNGGGAVRLLPQGTDSFFELETGVNWRFERPPTDSLGAATKLVRELRTQKFEAVRVQPPGSL